MKEALLTILRDRHTSMTVFRKTADQLADLIASDAASCLPLDPIDILTPIGPCKGKCVNLPVTLVPILRTGIVLLAPFLRIFPNAQVGFLGVKREELTAAAFDYYENIPQITSDGYVFLLDPMLATGGTALLAIRRLLSHNIQPHQIHIISILSSTPGRLAIQKAHPEVRLYSVAEDPSLNEAKFIVPGLGDFGDRYFGH